MKERDSIERCYPAVAGSVGEARSDLSALLSRHQISQEDLDRVRLAVSEAVTNAIVHAYAEDGVGQVQMTAAMIGEELVVIVADDGCGLGNAAKSKGLGIGMGLLTQMSDGLTFVVRSSGGTQVEMKFELPVAQRCCGSASGRRGSEASTSRPASPRFSTTT